jgi:hypothetical protein
MLARRGPRPCAPHDGNPRSRPLDRVPRASRPEPPCRAHARGPGEFQHGAAPPPDAPASLPLRPAGAARGAPRPSPWTRVASAPESVHRSDVRALRAFQQAPTSWCRRHPRAAPACRPPSGQSLHGRSYRKCRNLPAAGRARRPRWTHAMRRTEGPAQGASMSPWPSRFSLLIVVLTNGPHPSSAWGSL